MILRTTTKCKLLDDQTKRFCMIAEPLDARSSLARPRKGQSNCRSCSSRERSIRCKCSRLKPLLQEFAWHLRFLCAPSVTLCLCVERSSKRTVTSKKQNPADQRSPGFIIPIPARHYLPSDIDKINSVSIFVLWMSLLFQHWLCQKPGVFHWL